MCGGTCDYQNNALPSAFARQRREQAMREIAQAKLSTSATETEITKRASSLSQASGSTQELLTPNSKRQRLSRLTDRFCVKLGL